MIHHVCFSRLSAFTYSSYPRWKKALFRLPLRYLVANRLERVFEIGTYRLFSLYELARNIGITDIDGQCIMDEALRRLIRKGKVEQAYPGKFRLRSHCRFTGMVDLSSPKAPLLISSYKRPIRIMPHNLRSASHGDTVLVDTIQVTPHYLEAKVLRILNFSERNLVGTLEVLEQKAYFTPLRQELFCDIEIPLKHTKQARSGDSVVVQFDYRRQKNARRITGKVVKVLGDAHIGQVKTVSQLYSRGFSADFSPEEEAAAAAVDFRLTEEEIAKRLDLRGVLTFTVDPEETRDIDDALSFREMENGNYEVGVHIADISHYVKPGSLLDKLAYERSQSVYLADRTLPMFPNPLTYGCSLFAGHDKLAFSVLFEIDSRAKVVGRRIAKTVIRSQRQFSYPEAQQLISHPKDEPFSRALGILFDLSRRLRERRFDNGAITFEDRLKPAFVWDQKGKVVGVKPYQRIESMRLIEEFMLLANRHVAEMAAQRYIPCIYRSHGAPRISFFRDLCRVAMNHGFEYREQNDTMGNSNYAISKNISGFLSQARNRREEYLFTYLTIRSMAQGKYSPVPRRHFALALRHYTHFTSPIRRYADIMVHRILCRELIDASEWIGAPDFEAACKHLNRMHQQAKQIERYVDRQKCAEFLRYKIGQAFEGTIIGLTEAGLLIGLLEFGIQGRILLQSLLDDRYRLDPQSYTIRGKNKKSAYKIGDKLSVRLVSVDVRRGLIDFAIP
ncbi:MAG: VacB/RNase II family 3'-5' exoribonuclease [Dysgonamonadaceae bacterium]|jgi:ribonuclease R|nr:VacB/RNase II family 3'-5' exoribonuclease [Dysgonamonadaceae bacterium]